MNEKLIKDLVKFKLIAADEILSHLPQKVSNEVKDFGRIILEGVNENLKTIDEQHKKTKSSSKLNDIPIE